MSELPSLKQQEHEGPWRKLTPGRVNSVLEVNEHRPDGKTGKEVFDELYGQGNWEFQERNSVERQLEVESTRSANRIAMEGLKNVIANNIASDALGEPRKPTDDTYVDNEGNRLTGKVENRAVTPAVGDILISPDGDRHFEEWKEEHDA